MLSAKPILGILAVALSLSTVNVAAQDEPAAVELAGTRGLPLALTPDAAELWQASLPSGPTGQCWVDSEDWSECTIEFTAYIVDHNWWYTTDATGNEAYYDWRNFTPYAGFYLVYGWYCSALPTCEYIAGHEFYNPENQQQFRVSPYADPGGQLGVDVTIEGDGFSA